MKDYSLYYWDRRLDEAEVIVGKTHAVIQAAVKHFRTAPAFSISLKIPTVPCQDVVDSAPRGFAPMLDGMICGAGCWP